MKKETKELLRVLGVAFMLMMVVPLVYRAAIYFWPPEEKPRRTLSQFFEEAQMTRCMKLLTTPVAKWSDDEAKSEPEIYAWLKEQGDEILPWEWTEEARRKDKKGYAKCWRRIWTDQLSRYVELHKESQKKLKRLEQQYLILTTIHTHRTNQIVRLRGIAATNSYPCQVSLERIEKGRFWGWNTHIQVIRCENAEQLVASAGGIIGDEVAKSQEEGKSAQALSESIASSKERSGLYEKMREICDRSNSLIEKASLAEQDESFREWLVEVLKGEKK